MLSTETLLHRFYSSFQKKDYGGMQVCYADDAQFTDPVFQHLSSAEVKGMWEMLCKRAGDLELRYNIISANEAGGTALWTANYTFSRTGRKVVNQITSRFKFRNGLITDQVDTFDLYKWANEISPRRLVV